MPQLSLYLDKDTLQLLERAAKIEHLSLSKYVTKKLRESIQHDWPKGYSSLFGSVTDNTFSYHTTETFNSDIPREVL